MWLYADFYLRSTLKWSIFWHFVGKVTKGSEDKETVQSAQLRVYWKPKLSIVRSHGSFKARVYDVVKSEIAEDKNSDAGEDSTQITMLLDTKKIHHRNAELDEGRFLNLTPGCLEKSYNVSSWL